MVSKAVIVRRFPGSRRVWLYAPDGVSSRELYERYRRDECGRPQPIGIVRGRGPDLAA